MGRSLFLRACALAMAVGLASAPAAAAAGPMVFAGRESGPSTLGAPLATCPAGSMWYVAGSGVGSFTGLGRVTYTFGQCAMADMTTGWGHTLGTSTMTLVSAKGDKLALSYDMTFHATPMPIPKTADAFLRWTVAGGTGRFVHAHGSGDAWMYVQYSADVTGAQMSSVWLGWLAF